MTLLVETDSDANAKILAILLKRLDFVKTVTFEPTKKTTRKPLTAADWVRPNGPATDEEIEQLLHEMKQDTGEYSSEDVLHFVNEELTAWRKNKK